MLGCNNGGGGGNFSWNPPIPLLHPDVCAYVTHVRRYRVCGVTYGVATMCRLLEIIGLFCRTESLL